MRNQSIKTILILAMCICTNGAINAQKQGQSRIDSLLKVLPDTRRDTDRISILTNLSYIFAVINPDEGIIYGNKALELAERRGFKRAMPAIYENIGTNYSYKNNYQEALIYYTKALEIYRKNGWVGSATAKMNIGTIHLKKGNYPLALEFFFNALRIHESTKNEEGVAEVYSNIGNVYLRQGDLAKSLKYHFLAAKIFEELGNKIRLGEVLGNIGGVYYCQNNYPEALKYLTKALQTDEAIGNKNGMATVTGNIASIYLMQKKYSEALDYYYKGLKISEENKDKTTMVNIIGNIGNTYLFIATDLGKIKPGKAIPIGRKANFQKAIEYYKKTIKLCEEINDSNNLSVNLNNIAEAYSHIGNYKEALLSYERSVAVRDSLFSKANTARIVGIEMQYDFDKKAAASQARHDKQMALTLERNKTKLKVGGISAVSILFMGFMAFYFYRKREKDKLEQEILEVRQEALNAQMSDHFIGNTIDSINSFIKNDDKNKAGEYLLLFSRLIRKVLENSSEKTIPLREDLGILNDYIEIEKLRFSDGVLHHAINIENEIDADNVLIPPMIFQVLAENAIKHGFRKTTGGSLVFSVHKNGNDMECMVEDNGNGRRTGTISDPGQNNKRTSLGSSLAEKLVRTGSRYAKNTTYKIIDLFDQHNNPIGTRAVFTLPYILAE